MSWRRLTLHLFVFVILSALALGAHSGTLHYVYDPLGRLIAEIDPGGETTIYTYDPAGNILSVSRGSSSELRVIAAVPPRGAEGDTVTIYGSGFIPDPAQNSVSFNGVPASVSAATGGSVIVTVPTGATTGPITITNSTGSAVSATPFTVLFPPIITSVNPAYVWRGITTPITVTGLRLSGATDVDFADRGITTQITSDGTSDTELNIDLIVTGEVAYGTYTFTVTNQDGSSDSGSISIEVTPNVLGESFTATPSVSVHIPEIIPGAPPGDTMSTAGQPVSVHLPELIPGAPPGNTMSVMGQPVSVHLRAPIGGAPDGNTMTVTNPISVQMP